MDQPLARPGLDTDGLRDMLITPTPVDRRRSRSGSDPTESVSRAALVGFQLPAQTTTYQATESNQAEDGTQATQATYGAQASQPDRAQAIRAQRPIRQHYGPIPPPAPLSETSHPEVFYDYDSNSSLQAVAPSVERVVTPVPRVTATRIRKSQEELLQEQVATLQARLAEIERRATERPSYRAATSAKDFNNGELKPGRSQRRDTYAHGNHHTSDDAFVSKNTHSIRVKASDVPKFKAKVGEDVDIWISQVSSIYSQAGCSDDDLLQTLFTLFQGKAAK